MTPASDPPDDVSSLGGRFGTPPPDGGLQLAAEAARALEGHMVEIPGFPTPGVTYIDVYRTFDRHPAVRGAVLRCLASRYAGWGLDAVAGIATGAISLGSCLAMLLDVPFHPIRKPGETVHDAFVVEFSMVYADRALTLARDIVVPGSKVVLVDDVLASGASAAAGLELLSRAGADVREVATLFEVVPRGGRATLGAVPVFSIHRCEAL